MRVLEHDLPRSPGPLVLHFLVRYYPESFALLRDPAAVELFYQQAKSGVFKVGLGGAADGDEDLEGRIVQNQERGFMECGWST